MKLWFLRSWLLDINRGYEDALHYSRIDTYTTNVLWIHFFVFSLLAITNSYLKLALSFQTPLSLRVIPDNYAILTIICAFFVSAIPILLRKYLPSHYLYRILVTTSLTIYTFLFIFISGGSIEMHFHFFIVMAFIAIYVDFRLEWLVLFLAILHHTFFDIFAPHWLFYYGHSKIAPFVHALTIFITALLTTFLCKSLREALIEQKNLEKRKDDFISMTSHELKTPITSITLFLDVLEQKLHKKKNTEYDSILERVDYQVAKLSKLIRDLLDVSRLQSNRLAFEFTRIDINSLITQTVENIKLSAPDHKFAIYGKSRKKIFGDWHRISQVVENLLLNATKYSPRGSEITITVKSKEKYIIVSVEDQGVGIERKHHEAIFHRFYRVYEEEEKTFPGMGIGLYISQSIIANHGGKMWVESTKGKGSTFYFTLPYNTNRRKKRTRKNLL